MKPLSYLLIIIPIVLIGLRIIGADEKTPGIISDFEYTISYEVHPDNELLSSQLSKLVPANNFRQSIEIQENEGYPSQSPEGAIVSITKIADNRIPTPYLKFKARTKAAEYRIDEDITIKKDLYPRYSSHLRSTESIQSDHAEIHQILNQKIEAGTGKTLQLITDLYDFVLQIPTTNRMDQEDALSCLNQNVCTEKSKSRLLTALFRASGIPSRPVSGLILNDSSKHKLSYWTEAFIEGEWVPFDTYRDHFAAMPSNYLEIYKGDISTLEGLHDRSNDLQINIHKERINDYTNYSTFSIWSLIDEGEFPAKPVSVLLLLPLGAYIVAIFKNVVGLKTYGVFLPVLIAFAFINMGMLQGLVFFTLIIGVLSLISFPLEKWGILHTPKIVFLLTAVSLYCLMSILVFYHTNWVDPKATLTFPLIILTMIAERFAQKIEEESLADALWVYFQTIIVTLSCFLILSTEAVQHLVITFPESLLIVLGLSLILGRWIGIQLLEYYRFYKLDSDVSYTK